MKKIIILIAFISIQYYVYSQEIKTDENGNEYVSEIVEIELSKEVLFSNAQEWIAKTFGDYKSVIQFEDKESGKLILKGKSGVDYVENHSSSGFSIMMVEEMIKYTITIECKDNRYRYTISDFIIEKISTILSKNISEKERSKHLEDIETYKSRLKVFNNTLDSLKSINEGGLSRRERTAFNEKLKDTQSSIDFANNQITHEILFLEKEEDALINLAKSLKISMAKDDSF